ncbi:hypothetical protein G7Y89_g13098 [Cudoniella acicularis]|uniref:Uncharacterized protein n=1 Tax=Cudoniella acicularis TaxID=354080 RepID=A0A8H4R9Y4_9HELO|nr:hypothetical protein G7Y89_g13098 [Cudoniella acicularis]
MLITVQVQTFFGVGFQRYFIVKCQEETPPQAEAADDDEDAAVRDQLLREFDEIDERDTKRLEIADSKTEKSDNTDKQLQRVSEIVDMMIKRAVDGLSSLHDDTPYWLRTANSTEKVENRPMVRLQNEDSLDRYIAYLRRFACYLLRVYVEQKERETRESNEGESGGGESDDNNKDNFDGELEEGEETQQAGDSKELDVMKDCCELTKFSPEQKQLLQDMLELLEAGEDEDIQVQKMSTLIMSMILQSLKGCDRFDSPVIHFAVVLGIVEDENRLKAK